MGRDVSTIKSITSDIWSAREVEAMREMGNRKANAMYLATYKGNSRAPSGDNDVYRLIKDKYRDKLYMREKDRKSVEERGRSASASKHASANRSASSSSATAKSDVKIEAEDHVTFAGQLKVLVSMGFTDTTKNLKALKRAKGGVDASVEILLANPSPETKAPVEKIQRQASASNNVSSKEELSKTLQSALQFMEGMGFTDKEDNLAALKKAGGNVDQAVTILMNAPQKSTKTQSPAVTAAQRPSTGGIGMDLLSLEETQAQRQTPVTQASDSPFGGFFSQPPVQQQNAFNNSMSTNNMQPFNPQAQFQQQMHPFQQSQQSQLQQPQSQQSQLQFQQPQLQQAQMQQNQLQQNQLQQLQLQQLQQAQSQNPMEQPQNQQQRQQQNLQSQMWATLSQPQQQQSQSLQQQPTAMQTFSPSSSASSGPNYNPYITPNSGSIFLQKGNPSQSFNSSNSSNSNGASDPFSSLVKDSMRAQNSTPFANSNSNAFGSPMNQGMGQFQQQQPLQQQQQQQPGYSMYSAASQPTPYGGFTQSQVPRSMMDSPFNSQGMSTQGMQGMPMQQQQQQQLQQQQFNHQQQKPTNPFF
ncbi:hypothetical protein HDU81_006860 [Chytriomyces hyalinus]|nr:hypothetical protein HDU81_006860 [Chytriomyces hyalinus]